MKKRTTQLKKQALKFAAFLLLFLTSPAFAQVQLAAWNPSSLSGYGPSPWPATASSASVTVGGWTRGAGVGTSGTAAGAAWGGVAWTGNPTEDATFTITSNPGSTVSYSVFNLSYRRSNTGATGGLFQYAIGAASTTYSLIAPFTFNAGNGGNAHAPINMGGIAALQNVAPGTVIKFRILPTGGASTGTWYIYLGGASIEGSFSNFGATITPSVPIACNSQSNGVLSVSVSGGTAPYTYTWMPSGGTASVASGLAAGVYTCYINGALPTETTFATYTLTQPAVVSASIVSQGNVTCYGGSNGSVTVAGTGGTPSYSYSWSPSGGINPIMTNLSVGIYTLTVTDSHTCTGTQTVSITQPMPTLIASSSNSVICNGSTVTLNATGPNTYTWTNGVTSGIPFSPSVTATYTVGAANGTGGCTETNTITITVNASPTVTATADFTTACNGSEIILTAAGADTYTWSNGITDGIAFTPTATAEYTVTGTNTNNCIGTGVITITVNALPTVSITPASAVLCKGKTTTLTAAGATTYSWSTSATTTSVTVSPTITTSYSVTGTDANGCVNTAVHSQSVSPCLGIENFNIGEQVLLTVFPNPNNGEFVIKNASDIDLLIINSLGQTVQAVQLNAANNHELHVSNLNTGIYFIMSAKSAFNVKQKVIVTK